MGLASAYSSYADRDAIEGFLARKPHLVEALNDLASHLAEKHDVTEIRLEHTARDYYSCDAIRVTPKFRTEDLDELIEIQTGVLDDFFDRRHWTAADGVIFSF